MKEDLDVSLLSLWTFFFGGGGRYINMNYPLSKLVAMTFHATTARSLVHLNVARFYLETLLHLYNW